MERRCFLVTTFVKNQFQEQMLVKNIQSIRQYHPDAALFILNDNHGSDLTSILKQYSDLSGVSYTIELTPFPRCGEVNAYVWSILHKDEYDMFVYLHDSTVVKSPLPLELGILHYKPFWYAGQLHSSQGLVNKQVQDVYHAFQIDGKTFDEGYTQLTKKELFVVFGAMGIWDSTFANFLATRTNFLHIAHMMNTRGMRCLMERLAYQLFLKAHPTFQSGKFPTLAPCGDIFKHKNFFKNTTIDVTLSNNPFLLKVWQGR